MGSLDALDVVAILEKRAPANYNLPGILDEADNVFQLNAHKKAHYHAVEVHITRVQGGTWTGKIIPGPLVSPRDLSRSQPMAVRNPINIPDLFGPQHLYRRVYDRSVEQRKGD